MVRALTGIVDEGHVRIGAGWTNPTPGIGAQRNCHVTDRAIPLPVSMNSSPNSYRKRYISHHMTNNLLILITIFSLSNIATRCPGRIICRPCTSYDRVNEIVFTSHKYYKPALR